MEKSLSNSAFETISENIKVVEQNIADAAEKSGRKYEDIHFMAVTKTIDSDRINHALSQGITLIGENRVQEFLQKEPELNLTSCKAHLIGHLQSNKAKKIVGKVDMIQSVDTVEIAKEISKHAKNLGITQDVLLEVNVGNEWSKFGFDIDEVEEKAHEIALIDSISIKGLMCVAPICENEKDLRNIFSLMYKKYVDIRDKKTDNISMEILSMGMSGDYECAIEEGANLVRVGSAIFGPRIYYNKH